MKKILLFAILLLHHPLQAQHFLSRQWDARFGGSSNDDDLVICRADDGGLFLAGGSVSPIGGNKSQSCLNGSTDYWIVRTDSTGTYIWDKTIGTNDDDWFTCAVSCTDGGIVVGGYSYSDINVDKTQNSRGGWDYWIVKLDLYGHKLWDKTYGGADGDYMRCIRQTRDGGFIIGGYSSSNAGGDKSQDNHDSSLSSGDFWVLRIDSNGNKLWDKSYGSKEDESCLDIIEASDGGFLLGGYSNLADTGADKSQPNFGTFVTNMWVVKTDSIGRKLWDRVYGGSNGEVFASVMNSNDGNLLVAGTSYSDISGNKTSAQNGYWLVKVDLAGNKLGDWSYGSSPVPGQFLHWAAQTQDGGYLLTGTSGDVVGGDKSESNLSFTQVWTIKLDSQMHRVWDKTSLTSYSSFIKDKAGGAVALSNHCYVIGVSTVAGVGGEKSQPNWDNMDSTTDYWIVQYCDTVLTSTKEIDKGIFLSIFPNPTEKEVYLHFESVELESVSTSLYDANCKLVYQSVDDHLCKSYTKILDLTTLPSGSYFIDLLVGDRQITRMILKQ